MENLKANAGHSIVYRKKCDKTKIHKLAIRVVGIQHSVLDIGKAV